MEFHPASTSTATSAAASSSTAAPATSSSASRDIATTLPPIRPIGERYDGLPMPSVHNIANYPLPVSVPISTPISPPAPAKPAVPVSRPTTMSPKKRSRKDKAPATSLLPAPLPSPSISHSPTSPPHPSAPPTVPSPPKRGRKPTHTARAARDTARKVNHSRIEKRRRERINDALAALRELVPQEPEAVITSPTIDAVDPSEIGQEKKRSAKEYKLEVLDRTVSYVRVLVDRVRLLEQAQANGGCTNCAGGLPAPLPIAVAPAPLKRKRDEDYDSEDDDSASHNSDSDAEPDEPPRPLLPTPSLHPYYPPSTFVPSSTPASNNLLHLSALLLPSPPTSVPSAPSSSSSYANPPFLSLPGPHFAHEEEAAAAANVLLQLHKDSDPSLSNDDRERYERGTSRMQALTPMAALGMSKPRG